MEVGERRAEEKAWSTEHGAKRAKRRRHQDGENNEHPLRRSPVDFGGPKQRNRILRIKQKDTQKNKRCDVVCASAACLPNNLVDHRARLRDRYQNLVLSASYSRTLQQGGPGDPPTIKNIEISTSTTTIAITTKTATPTTPTILITITLDTTITIINITIAN